MKSLRRTTGSYVAFEATHFKLLLQFWTGLLLLFLVGASRLALAQNQEDDTRALGVKLAASKAAEVLIGKIENEQPQAAVSNCSAIILSNSGQHRERNTSEVLLRQGYRRLVENGFQSELSKLHKRFHSGTVTDQWFTLDWLQGHARQKYGGKLDQSIEANLAGFYSGVFAEARRLAVENQSRRISPNVYPEPEEVEAFEKASWSAGVVAPVKSRLTASASRNLQGPMLQEVEQQVDALVNSSFEFARSQIAAQNKVATEFMPETGSISRNQLETELRKAVNGVVAEFRKTSTPDQKVYDPFPSIEPRLHTRAANLERDRFIEFLNQFQVQPDQQRLEESIKGALDRHKRFLDSLNLLVDGQLPQLVKEAVNTYSGKLPDAGQRSGFITRLNEHLVEGGQAQSALRQATARSLSTPLRSFVRPRIAREQVQKHFPAVTSGAWVVGERILDRNSGESSEGLRRPINVGNIDDCLQLADINEHGDPFKQNSLLEETESLLIEKCQKLLAEAQDAWVGQLNLVHENEPAMKHEITANFDSKTLDQWVAYFQESIGTDWKQKRIGIIWRGTPRDQWPPNADVKYSPLFGYTKIRIRQAVKDNFVLAVAAIEEKKREESRKEQAKKQEEIRKQEEARKLEETRQEANRQQAMRQEAARQQRELMQAQGQKNGETSTNAAQLAQRQSSQATNDSKLAQSGGSSSEGQSGVQSPGGGDQNLKGETGLGGAQPTPTKQPPLRPIPWLLLLLLALLLGILIGWLLSRARNRGQRAKALAAWKAGGILVIGNMAIIPVNEARKVWPERFAASEREDAVTAQR